MSKIEDKIEKAQEQIGEAQKATRRLEEMVSGGTEPVKESEAPVKTVDEMLDEVHSMQTEVSKALFVHLDFRPGDLVMLKSGGPVMAVEHCSKLDDEMTRQNRALLGSKYTAACSWFDGDGINNEQFSFDALQLVKKGPYHD